MTKYPYTISYYKKSKKPKASVIICTVSRPSGVERGLGYLRKQIFKDFEVIIVDGLKNNKLNLICKKFSKDLVIKRIKINKRNLPYSRNQGISASRGDVISFHDDDAYAEADWLKNIIKTFDKNKDIVGIGGTILSANKYYFSEYAERLFDYGSVSKKLKTITGANMSFYPQRLKRLKKYKRDKIFNEEYLFAGEETDACFYINKSGGILRFEPGIVVHHDFETDPSRFIRKHYFYGQGDFKVMTTNDFKYLSLIEEYLTPVRQFKTKLVIPFIMPFIVLKKSFNFIRIYGVSWVPAALLRETVYALGLYTQMLKERDALSKIS